MFNRHKYFMQCALRMAEEAASRDEVPVGAVIVHEHKIIAQAYNQVELLRDATAHAEMIAVTQACNSLNQKWLKDCVLYVTLEPCSMCAGALVLARIKKLVFGAADPKAGACGSIINIARHKDLNHRIHVEGGCCAEACANLLSEFFKKKRARRAT